jgi:hypothetical protein
MTNHTPGPWMVKHQYNVIGQDDRMVATCGGYANNSLPDSGFGQNCANARMIAAAPDMLAALKRAVAAADSREKFSERTQECEDDYQACVAAIAKAEAITTS